MLEFMKHVFPKLLRPVVPDKIDAAKVETSSAIDSALDRLNRNRCELKA